MIEAEILGLNLLQTVRVVSISIIGNNSYKFHIFQTVAHLVASVGLYYTCKHGLQHTNSLVLPCLMHFQMKVLGHAIILPLLLGS